MSYDDDEPDGKIQRTGLSRREALALGVGSVTGLSGCASLGSNFIEDEESELTVTDLDPQDVNMGASPSFGIDGSTVELNIRGFASAQFDYPFEGTLRVYAVPHRETIAASTASEIVATNLHLLAERDVTQNEMRETYSFEFDYPEGYAQRFVITAEVTDPASLDEHVIHRSDQIYLPFTNEARGEPVLYEINSNRPSEDQWQDGGESVNAVEFWFDEPEESPFDVPSIDESQYDPDWYRYRDLTVSVVVRFATYDSAIGGTELPVFEWMAFSFQMSEWELLEAFRWNSIATQEREYRIGKTRPGPEEYEPIEEPSEFGSMMSDTGQLIYNEHYMEATESPTPFEMYRPERYESGDINNQMNPLYFAGGRPLCKRLAQTIEDVLDNPSFNALSNQPYYKATALKTFVGGGIPYSFNREQGNYNMAPEEIIANWYLRATEDDPLGADCQDASHLFCGIAVHLLDTRVGYVSIPSAAHAVACLFDFDSEVWEPDEHPLVRVGSPQPYDTRQGEARLVECTYGASTIGYRLKLDSSEMQVRSYFIECPLLSHIPLTDDYRPHADGSIRAPAENPENPFVYADNHETISA